MRQEFDELYIENGSFYLFTPNALKIHDSRFGMNTGMAVIDCWKMFEIDEPEDLEFCEMVMRHYILEKRNG
jgi:N-acylneuraminate cytidylyltransferase